MLSDQEDKDSTLTVHLRVGLHHLLDLVEARLLVMLGGGATAEKTLPPSDMISQNLDFYYDRHESYLLYNIVITSQEPLIVTVLPILSSRCKKKQNEFSPTLIDPLAQDSRSFPSIKIRQ